MGKLQLGTAERPVLSCSTHLGMLFWGCSLELRSLLQHGAGYISLMDLSHRVLLLMLHDVCSV